MSLSQNIKRFRLEKEMTQEQLASLLGISAQAVSKWETNETYPDGALLVPIANALDVSADELLCDCINQASNVYETEISLLLKNCSTKEICFIHDLVKNTLISLHNRNLK